jgi:hypothetical protein
LVADLGGVRRRQERYGMRVGEHDRTNLQCSTMDAR